MEELRGHLLGDESIFTFTRGCADFRDPTAVFRMIEPHGMTTNFGGKPMALVTRCCVLHYTRLPNTG